MVADLEGLDKILMGSGGAFVVGVAFVRYLISQARDADKERREATDRFEALHRETIEALRAAQDALKATKEALERKDGCGLPNGLTCPHKEG